jgi:hypothetical protein
MMPMPTYVELIDEICYHLTLEIKESFEGYDPEDLVYQNIEDWMQDTYSFGCGIQDRQEPHIKKALGKYGMDDETDDFYAKLTHEGALFVIRNSQNIHTAIDGSYRKDGYKDIAMTCIRGDIVLHIARIHNVLIDPKTVPAFNRIR